MLLVHHGVVCAQQLSSERTVYVFTCLSDTVIVMRMLALS
jgi:hypothetical protein